MGISIWQILTLIILSFLIWVIIKIFKSQRRNISRRNKGNGNIMGFRKKNEYLIITDKTIKYTDKKHTDQVYQLSNITQITKHKLKHKRLVMIIMAIALGFGGVALIATDQRDLQPLALGAFVLAIIFILIALLRKNHYALILETSSGMGEVLVSKDEKFIDDLVTTITDVMENQIKGTNIIAYPDTMTINNQSFTKNVAGDEVTGDKFENIKNSAISNRSDNANVTNTINEKYGEEIEKALDELAAHIRECNDVGSEALLEKLRAILCEPEPDKTRISALWNTLVQVLPDVSKVATSIKTIAAAIL